MCTILNTIHEGFLSVCSAKAAAEIKNGIVVIQREGAEEFFQFLKSSADLQKIGFMGFGIGLLQLIQNSFAIAVTKINGMRFYVGFHPFCNLIHVGTSLLSAV